MPAAGFICTFTATVHGIESVTFTRCGAGYRERSDERSNQRNGYRHRDFDTRAATIDVGISCCAVPGLAAAAPQAS
ncbi:transposase [Mycobacterium tuberculosis]